MNVPTNALDFSSLRVSVVGIGCNLTGGAFTTADGRAATSLAALLGDVRIDRVALAEDLAARVGALLLATRRQ